MLKETLSRNLLPRKWKPLDVSRYPLCYWRSSPIISIRQECYRDLPTKATCLVDMIFIPTRYDKFLGISASMQWTRQLTERLESWLFHITLQPHCFWTSDSACEPELVQDFGETLEKSLNHQKSEGFVINLSRIRLSSNAWTEEPRDWCSIDDLDKFPAVSPDDLSRKLLVNGPVDHVIDLIPDSRPVSTSPYRVSGFEEEVWKSVQKLLCQGLFWPSASVWAAPGLFAPKKNGNLRLCEDYRTLNN